ncbi:MAG: peptidase [Halobacteriovoraceae bacterium]|nr:peptidase [Halobacteriovoraceae bacterium]
MLFKDERYPFKIIALLFLSILSDNLLANEKVIYGEDDRKDLYEITDLKWIENAQSVAALIPLENLKEIGDDSKSLRLNTSNLIEEGVCRDERFTSQEAAAECSGFLVDDDLMITAGHCVKSLKTCEKTRWVFGYDLSTQDKDYRLIPKKNVFKCSEVISFFQGDHDDEPDYAILRLDRPVLGRKPLQIRKEGRIKKGGRLYIAGFPLGLPLKMAGGGWVRKNSKGPYFITNLDSFEGNSGAPVFSERDQFVEGILVGGEDDFFWDSKKDCYRVKRCSEKRCQGESVTKITALKELRNLIAEN